MAGSVSDTTLVTGPEARPVTSIRVPLIVACAFFMENLDSTVINTALPKMAASFGQNPIALNTGVTAYVLTLAVFIPLSAWVAERFGPRNVFAAAIAVFTGASMLCGASASLPQFLAARVLQGVGGAMMVPVGRMIVLRGTPKSDLLRAMAYLTWPALVGPIVGPFVGGLIATYFSWRWIFFINAPVGLIGIFLVWRFIRSPALGPAVPFDSAGFLLTGLGLVSLMLGLGLLAHGDESRASILELFALSALGGLLAWRHLRRAPHPLVDLRPFELETFSAASLGGSFSRFAVNAGTFVLPLMFQVGFGFSPFISGLFMLIGAVGSLSTKAIAARLVRQFGFRRVLLVNSVLIAAATLACAGLARSTPALCVGVVMVGCGFTRSLQFTCLNTLGFADMPSARVAAASMLTSMLQQLVIGMSVACAAVMLRSFLVLHEGSSQPQDFRWVLTVLAGVSLLGMIRFYRLPEEAGSSISGRRT